MFQVFLSRKANKRLNSLDDKLKAKIEELLRTFESYPVPARSYDVRKVSGIEDVYRIRISQERVIYHIDWNNKEINVIKIEKRDETTYKRL